MEGISQIDKRTICHIVPEQGELLRYMGYRGSKPVSEAGEDRKKKDTDAADPAETLLQKAQHCVSELRGVCRPQFISRRFQLEGTVTDSWAGVRPEASSCQQAGAGQKTLSCQQVWDRQVRFADVVIESRDLARNLEGCTQIVLFAATLGVGPDRLIARAGVGHVSDMMILQAASAAMIEAWCDEKNAQITEAAGREGFLCRPRFSPGYGDFSLEHQKDILRLLDGARKVGITLTDSMLMAPSKSVTAVIGLYPSHPEMRSGQGTSMNDGNAAEAQPGVQSPETSGPWCPGTGNAGDTGMSDTRGSVREKTSGRCRSCTKTDCAFRR